MSVSFNRWAMGRMEEYWDKPLEFRPERFLGENGGKPVNSAAFAPFSIGPRICLGREMAYVQAKVIATMILQRYRLVLVPNHAISYQMGIVLKCKNGMLMYAVARK